MQTSLQARQNAKELQDYFKDLSKWESEIKNKDSNLLLRPDLPTQVPPIRNLQSQNPQIPPSESDSITPAELALIEKEKKAIAAYSKSVSFDSNPSTPAVYTNRALCFLKLSQFNNVIKDCDLALELESKNVKALWRRGLAKTELKDWSSAKS
ncbi:RNA polymerase II-associated protein 3, partial [Nowakowskiella sp. JEL0078]